MSPTPSPWCVSKRAGCRSGRGSVAVDQVRQCNAPRGFRPECPTCSPARYHRSGSLLLQAGRPSRTSIPIPWWVCSPTCWLARVSTAARDPAALLTQRLNRPSPSRASSPVNVSGAAHRTHAGEVGGSSLSARLPLPTPSTNFPGPITRWLA